MKKSHLKEEVEKKVCSHNLTAFAFPLFLRHFVVLYRLVFTLFLCCNSTEEDIKASREKQEFHVLQPSQTISTERGTFLHRD